MSGENFNKRRKKMIRETKSRLYQTSNGDILLNPFKRALKGKPYKNEEHKYIMDKEIKSALEDLGGVGASE